MMLKRSVKHPSFPRYYIPFTKWGFNGIFYIVIYIIDKSDGGQIGRMGFPKVVAV